jgi:hypothetical protein
MKRRLCDMTDIALKTQSTLALGTLKPPKPH